MSIQSDLMVARDPRSNKTGLRLSPVNPSAISLLPHPFSTPHQARRATGGQTTMESRWTGDLGDACTHHGDDRPPLRDNGVRGATAGPFVGVRTHRRVDAPPSSGSMVVPTGSLPHGGVAPSMWQWRLICTHTAMNQSTSSVGAPSWRRPERATTVAQPLPVRWFWNPSQIPCQRRIWSTAAISPLTLGLGFHFLFGSWPKPHLLLLAVPTKIRKPSRSSWYQC
jgi:hypothetical protein